MKKRKRFLAILLAMLLIGGAAAVGATAADEPAAPELTKEMAAFSLPITVVTLHYAALAWTPDILRFKPGKNENTLVVDIGKNIEAMIEENEWDIEEALFFPNIDANDIVNLYSQGILEDYMNGMADAYEKALKDNCPFVCSWSYAILKWVILSPVGSKWMLRETGYLSVPQ
ncbi:MAG: hypothetical protein LBS96_07085 [Oscillospiraceae bacterium]|jgi:hypothetical protein|nr:hypothetical protein [Oscillospiraceae bacterium]